MDGPAVSRLRAKHLPDLQWPVRHVLGPARRDGAKLAEPGRRVLAAAGDGAFLMNSQEIETALRERIPVTVLIWQDNAYGLIRWKMDLELGHDAATGFGNPDFVAYAESFGARGYRINSAGDLLPTLTEALAADTVSVITCPVDYSENLRLMRRPAVITKRGAFPNRAHERIAESVFVIALPAAVAAERRLPCSACGSVSS